MVLVGLHILCHLAVSVGSYVLQLDAVKAAENVEDQVEVMYAPVDQNAAAGLLLGGESAAKAGDGAVSAEGADNVVDLTEATLTVELLEQLDGLIVAVADADVEHLALTIGLFLHLAGKGVVNGNGLLAENVLAGTQRIHGDDVVHIVGGQHEYGFDLGVSQCYVVVCNDLFDLGELFLGGLCLVNQQIASVFDADVVQLGQSGQMCAVGDSTATDNSNCFHNETSCLSRRGRGLIILWLFPL